MQTTFPAADLLPELNISAGIIALSQCAGFPTAPLPRRACGRDREPRVLRALLAFPAFAFWCFSPYYCFLMPFLLLLFLEIIVWK